MRKLIVTLGLFFAGGVIAFSALMILLNRPHSSHQPYPFVIEIPQGRSLRSIAAYLQHEGLIRWDWSLRLWVRFHPDKRPIRYGRYRFERPLSLPQLLDKLRRGQVELQKITFREGLTLTEMGQQLAASLRFSKEDFLSHCQHPELIREIDPQASNLEGYLYPDTYHVDPEITAEEMVQLMVNRFKEKYDRNLQWRANDVGMSNREIVTLASLIEMETANRGERFLISSVFHNRLRLKMRLDCDPTIVYALKIEARWDGALGWDDLKYDSPYNTRLYGGLPPGPICSPGFASIEAALYPEQTDYLYFVAKGGGNHHFSTNLKEHNAAVHQYIIQGRRDPL